MVTFARYRRLSPHFLLDSLRQVIELDKVL